MTHAVTTRDLTKEFGGETALAGLDLSVPAGSIFGLVGTNGAGKTTALRLLLGLAEPTSGESTIFGEDSLALSQVTRRRIGYLSEDDFPYDDIAFADVLKFVSGFFDTWDWPWCEHLIERLGVAKYKRLDQMSKGQRRIAEVLVAVAHKPDLLVLDDPAMGLDASVRREVLWTLLETVQEQGTTVLFSSHILQDVERIVDHVAILDGGRLQMVGELDEMKTNVRRLVLPATTAPSSIEGEIHREQHGRDVVIVTERYSPALQATLPDAESSTMNLEEIFLATTGGLEVH